MKGEKKVANRVIPKKLKSAQKVISKNSPTILMCISVAGVISTTAMGIKATPKALYLIELKKEEVEKDNLTKVETLKTVWKCYIPTVLMAGITIGCIIGSNHINLKRNEALAAAYSITATTLKEYQSKVVETIGANKEKKIKDEIAKDKIKNNPQQGKEVIFTGNGETLCYESISGRYFKSDIEKLRRVENLANNELLKDDFISLNDVYYEMGLPNTKMGDEIGWKLSDGMFAFDFSSQLSEDGVPCLVVDYDRIPRYDYMDYS